MAKNIAFVRPEMLIWARKDAGMSIEIAAARTRFPIEKLQMWESGENSPTILQAHKLARVYEQPFAAFYLPRPPQSKRPKVRDYRMLHRDSDKGISSDLTLEIRRACERREVALELYDEREETPPNFIYSASLKDNPEQLGKSIREKLNIDRAKQASWRTNGEAFRKWREAVEALGILVFQTEHVDVSEVRGFSISELKLPTIVINNKDAGPAKVFTLLHELIHIMLQSSGMCDPIGLYNRSSRTGNQIEVFCNRVAAEILIPKENFLSENLIFKIKQGQAWTDKDVVKLAASYNTSREAILRRLLTFNLITKDFYKQKRAEYQMQSANSSSKKKSGIVHPVTKSLSTNGKPFTKIVVNAYHSSIITASDLSNYLGVKLHHLKRLSETVGVD